MLRRSHKKSKGGCQECKRRHVKCDENRPRCRLCVVSERPCSFALEVTKQGHTSSHTSKSNSPADSPNHVTSTDSTIINNDPSKENVFASCSSVVNMEHMELLVHFVLDKDMFNLGVEHEIPHWDSRTIALRYALQAPYLMHQLLAFAARHKAYLDSKRSKSYLHLAMTLQTHAVSMFTETPIDINQSNCVPVLLFASALGHHLLADTLASRSSSVLEGFIQNYVQCSQTFRGIYDIAISAWSHLMNSELAPILRLSQSFTSQDPKGNECQQVSNLIDDSKTLNEDEKDACRTAIQYLQVGLDAALETSRNDVPINPYQMISEWTMLVPPLFTQVLAAKAPEAIVILAHYALLLTYGQHLWQVQDAGPYLLDIISAYLGPEWDKWLEVPRAKAKSSIGRK